MKQKRLRYKNHLILQNIRLWMVPRPVFLVKFKKYYLKSEISFQHMIAKFFGITIMNKKNSHLDLPLCFHRESKYLVAVVVVVVLAYAAAFAVVQHR